MAMSVCLSFIQPFVCFFHFFLFLLSTSISSPLFLSPSLLSACLLLIYTFIISLHLPLVYINACPVNLCLNVRQFLCLCMCLSVCLSFLHFRLKLQTFCDTHTHTFSISHRITACYDDTTFSGNSYHRSTMIKQWYFFSPLLLIAPI